MAIDPQRTLLSTFNFRIALNRSGGSSAGAALSFSASASAGASTAGTTAGVTAGVSATIGAAIGIGAGSSSAQSGDGGLQECIGLQIEMDVHDINVGGRNDGVMRLAGRGKYTPITLKRGM